MASNAARHGTWALVTRPREEAEALAKALAARGVSALVEPMMNICFHGAPPALAGVQAVLCTSANGVRALARADVERSVALYAVGDATATRARAEGFRLVASAGGDTADLVRLVAERLRPEMGRLLHVRGSAVAGDLGGELRARGFTVEPAVLYDARPALALSAAATRALAEGAIDFALFFSPRTSAIFAGLARAAGVAQQCGTAIALSISAAADKPLDAMPWRRRLVAKRPDQPTLLDLLDDALAARRDGQSPGA
jgi:uroporphyrinogen-III synthase